MQKVLVITYYWPPAGGPGVQRWVKFTKYLPEFDIKPVVFIPENPNYPLLDESLVKEVSNEIEVLKAPIFEPYRFASFFGKKRTKRISSGIIQKKERQSVLEKCLLWIRGNFFIPDARKYWVKPSVRFLKNYIQENGIKTIITTGPPHSVHLIGLQLKEQLSVKWIADFRDPWTTIGYHKKLKLTSASQKKHEQLEKEVLQSAGKLIVTSNTTQNEFQQKIKRPIATITNGFDGEFSEQELDKSFTISHIGTLLTDRNPDGLWIALQQLINENMAFSESLQIQLIGVVGDEVLKSLSDHGLANQVKQLGYVSHGTVQDYQAKSQVLLLSEIDSEETAGIIPGKLFEYMKAKRPILALGPKNWEAGHMVQTTNSGQYCNAEDVAAIKAVVLEWFENYQAGNLVVQSKGIEKYHRRELTRSLVDFIELI